MNNEDFMNYEVHQSILNKNLKNIKKNLGMFFTPTRIIDFMLQLIDDKIIKNKDLTILEPACGLAQFLIGIKKNNRSLFNRAKLFAVEINEDIINYLTNINIGSNIRFFLCDYLFWEPNLHFDLIIGNPPYGIPSPSDHYAIKIDNSIKEKYKRLYETWYGKYNIYGAFIEKSIKLLGDNGQLIFIVPATFLILDEFKKLRIFLSQNGKTTIIYMGPDVFKPEADVSAVVLSFLKSKEVVSRLELLEYYHNNIKSIKVESNWHGEVIRFCSKWTQKIENLCPYKLGDIFEIKISPRTPEIKKSPLIIKEKIVNAEHLLPLLNGRNLKCNNIIYDNLTGYWINKKDINKFRGFFHKQHIVVGMGFRGDGKVAAALDKRSFPWMGDVYHLLRKDSLFNKEFDLDDKEVVAYLNSNCVRRYIREVFREITYHLSISQLKSLPLPDKKAWQIIKKERLFDE